MVLRKFGIFIHWGAYSVPAFQNEWYPRNMYLKEQPTYKHHLETYGPRISLVTRTSSQCSPQINGILMSGQNSSKNWCKICSNCSYSDWNATKMRPKRDIVKDLTVAVREKGLIFGVSYHRAEHWWFFEGGMRFDSDVRDTRYYELYGPAKPSDTQPDEAFLNEWLGRAIEVYQKVSDVMTEYKKFILFLRNYISLNGVGN